jgi:D-3-phosphoglycerate dehydrogenase / 2-oxoglutarate reductase
MQYKKKILVSAPMEFVQVHHELASNFDLIINTLADIECIESMQDKDEIHSWVVSPCPTYFIDAKIISYFPNLRSVVTPSTGSNHIDKINLEKIGIEVYSLRDSELYNTILASSEYTFSLILSLIRKIPEASCFPLQYKWRESEKYLRSREVNNLTLGIIGLGRIGANVAKYASAMGMTVQYFDPFVDNIIYKQLKSIDDILSTSDVVLLSLILDESTIGLIDKTKLSKSKKGLLLVNTSRGEVIDEESVVSLLKSEVLGGYAADVLTGEIDGSWKESPILQLSKENKNIIITPHIAGLTIDSESKAQNIALKLAANSID